MVQRHFTIEKALIEDGFNDITLEWPELPARDVAAVSAAAHRYQAFGQSEWFTIFGEVFSFRIKAARSDDKEYE